MIGIAFGRGRRGSLTVADTQAPDVALRSWRTTIGHDRGVVIEERRNGFTRRRSEAHELGGRVLWLSRF